MCLDNFTVKDLAIDDGEQGTHGKEVQFNNISYEQNNDIAELINQSESFVLGLGRRAASFDVRSYVPRTRS